jgi:hypothetical protein
VNQMALILRRYVRLVPRAACASIVLALACSGAPKSGPPETSRGSEHVARPSLFAQVLWSGVGLQGIQDVDWSVPCQQLYQMRLPQLAIARPLAIREVRRSGHESLSVVLHVSSRWGRSIPSRTLSIGVPNSTQGGHGVDCWLSEPGLCGSSPATLLRSAVTDHDASHHAPQSVDEGHDPQRDPATPDTLAMLAIQCGPDAAQNACDGELRVEVPIDAAWLLRNDPEREPKVIVFLLPASVNAAEVPLAWEQGRFQLALPISGPELSAKIRAHIAATVGEGGF